VKKSCLGTYIGLADTSRPASSSETAGHNASSLHPGPRATTGDPIERL